MRVVGGEFRGRPLAGPEGQAIRPTSDRNRESLFNMLAHRAGVSLEGARVLDLFAGTGALGIEALSRGARFCVFIEEGVEGRGLIRRNVEALGLTGRTKIFRRDATRLGSIGTFEPFDLVLADPPYSRRLGEGALLSALEGGWAKPDALFVLEEAREAPFECPAGFSLEEERGMGETTVLRFLRLANAGAIGPT